MNITSLAVLEASLAASSPAQVIASAAMLVLAVLDLSLAAMLLATLEASLVASSPAQAIASAAMPLARGIGSVLVPGLRVRLILGLIFASNAVLGLIAQFGC